MVQDGSEPSEVERLRRENADLRRALARAGLAADAPPGTDQAGTVTPRGAAAALSTYQALVAELRTKDRRQAALIELGDRLRGLRGRTAIAQAGAEIIGRAIDASRAAYGTVDASAETVMIEVDWCAPGVASITGLRRFRDYGTFSDDLMRGDMVVVDDVATDPRTRENLPAFAEIGMRALINVPLVEGERTVGVAIIQHEEPYAWPVDELAFVAAAADRVRAAVARSEAETRQEVLNREISHRLKNTLTIVQAIVTQTLRDPPSLAEARRTLTDRLMALGRAHDILTSGSTQAADVATVVGNTLAPHGDRTGRIGARGPAIAVGPSAGLSLALMLHELATNAAKYGALSVPAGRVDLGWTLDRDGQGASLFVLTWTEVDGPAVSVPSRRGFGSRLIERGFGGSAEVALAFPPSGVVATLRAPLAAFQAGIDAAR